MKKSERVFVISCIILFFLFVIISIFNMEKKEETISEYKVNISKDDQKCLRDEDCTTVLTTVCSLCECDGEPVNTIHKEKYQQLYDEKEKLCDSIEHCEMDCPRCELKCVGGFCTNVCD